MKLYKFGVLVNGITLVILIVTFVAIQFSAYFNDWVVSEVIRPIFGTNINNNLFLFNNNYGKDTLEWYMPIAITVTWVLLVILNVLLPLVLLKKQVKSYKKVSLISNSIFSLLSFITFGGWIMFIALFNLKDSIYFEQKQIRKKDNSYRYTNHDEEFDYIRGFDRRMESNAAYSDDLVQDKNKAETFTQNNYRLSEKPSFSQTYSSFNFVNIIKEIWLFLLFPAILPWIIFFKMLERLGYKPNKPYCQMEDLFAIFKRFKN